MGNEQSAGNGKDHPRSFDETCITHQGMISTDQHFAFKLGFVNKYLNKGCFFFFFFNIAVHFAT